ncbi:ferredoxin [Frankia sp. CcI49]|uniref:2Fe-2S iron-sulfur cluster binding domain-containing protein n=2 Tax=Frankiales TaxID=85013 RepID=A0A0S4QVZ4_9ACTN|nr:MULTISPECIES: 2Fe-2S iron-sulfur cluster-binding protein [Parafrankia]EFC78772.1 ferredoxin [Parafrankia sp. EUN1f]KPM52501.1 ferredoxin [Frankia sp. R43]ONH59779.1 ferredoxin [Frankia sp. CcI49]EFC78892.1 ferredoxin [Parafrankia sp. EUN1f]MBE3205793.1 (2Fe-2S)-binding protein [Parafrankia sp. CH37]
MPSLKFVNADETVEFDGCVELIEMDDIITFGCRSGRCGICVVRIVSGGENLSPRTAREERLFGLLGEESPAMRLACQSRAYGDAVLDEIN